MKVEGPRGVTEGDALRYEASVDLSETNTARTQLVLVTGENKKVLEVGPATGYITRALTERGCRVTGLEIDPAAAEVSSAFAERMIVGDIEAMDLEKELGEERFDVVMYGDVLEHLVDPEGTLVKTKSILAPDGYVVASIPNVAHASVRLSLLAGEFRYSSEGLLDRTHLRFFTRESIRALFEAAGYDVREVRTSTTGPFGTELGLRSEDFPPTLVDAVMSLPDSDTYQFIVDARPRAVAAADASEPGGGDAALSRASVAPLWNAEELLAEGNRRIEELTEEVQWLRGVASRAEEAREGAQGELERVRGSRAYRVSRSLQRALKLIRGGRGRRSPRQRAPRQEPEDRSEPHDVADGYLTWIERFEPGPDELREQRTAAARLEYRPVISVVIPSAGPSSPGARQSIGSVRAQTYDRLQLCIAESVEDAVRGAEGEFTTFLEPGDVLAPFALYEIAVALERERDLDLIYADSDTISETGARSDPFFTPEWSPELLLSAPYPSHPLVVRTDLLREVGGPRPDMGAEMLWDLALRLGEQTRRIRRVPSILYHRAGRPQELQGMAVREHLDRRGRDGSVERTADGHLRVRWRVRGNPRVSVIIPTRHNRLMLTRCLASLANASYANREVLVVETAPRDGDKEEWYENLAAGSPVEVLWWERPFNYSAVNNWAASKATGDILLFLNDDTEAIGEDWLAEMVGWAQQDEIGAVGAQLLNEDGTIQHGGIVVGLTGFAGQLFKFLQPGDSSMLGSTMWYRNVLAVTGACMAMRRDVFDRVGGWDERYLLAGSDVELGLRLRRSGYRVVCTPFAQLRHREQATRGSDIPEADFHTSFRDFREFIEAGDPYFNPNLSYDATIPTLSTGEYSPMHTVNEILERITDGPRLSERA